MLLVRLYLLAIHSTPSRCNLTSSNNRSEFDHPSLLPQTSFTGPCAQTFATSRQFSSSHLKARSFFLQLSTTTFLELRSAQQHRPIAHDFTRASEPISTTPTRRHPWPHSQPSPIHHCSRIRLRAFCEYSLGLQSRHIVSAARPSPTGYRSCQQRIARWTGRCSR